MKRILTILPVLFLAVTACQEKVLPARLEVAQTNLSMESPAGETALELTATRSWVAYTDVSWCKVIPASGNGGVEASTNLHIILDENPGHSERTCQVTISSGGMKKTVEVKQGHKHGLLLEKTEFELSPDSQTLEIPAWTTVPVTVSIGKEESAWIGQLNTKAMQDAGIVLDIKENRFTTREGRIHLQAGGEDYTVTIRQKPGYVRISDPSFYNYCLYNFDFDRDGQLTMDDAVQVTSMSIGEDLHSIAGIEQFPELRNLFVYRFADTTLDLSRLTHLQRLYVGESPVRSINLGEAKELLYLDLNFTMLEQLDLRGRTGLETLYLNGNQKLSRLYLSGCSSLRELSITNSIFESLDLRTCKGLQSLNILQAYELRELNVSGLPELGRILIAETSLDELDLSACPALHTLIARYTRLRELSFVRTGLVQMELSQNSQLTSVRIDGCEQFASFACGACEKLESLAITDCPAFFGMEVSQCLASSITLKKLPEAKSVVLRSNQCSLLTLEDLPQCQQLYCDYNLLTSLDLSGCPALTYLFCSSNKLTELDLSAQSELQYLYCSDNSLQQLDLSKNPNLVEVNCNSNFLTELDLTSNSGMSLISCYNNPLKYIYLKSGAEHQPAINYDPTVTTIVYR